MKQRKLSMEQKRADIDLWIIIITIVMVLGFYTIFSVPIMEFVKNVDIPVLIRTICSAFLQFGIAGLGITIVCMLRKESFLSYGLHRKNLFLTIILSAVMFVPNILFTIVTGDFKGYLPLQNIWVTKDVLLSSIPNRIIGMALIATAWGFFEGFNYVVIMDKLNIRYQNKNKWLDIGAITCAIMCILIHGAIGVTPKGIIEMLTTLVIIYGMLMVRKFTGNAWGCVFVFVFLWNAY